jgi:hypothetical protein
MGTDMADKIEVSPTKEKLFERYFALLENKAVQSINHWKLPNDDKPFDAGAAAAEFEAIADDAFESTLEAISDIGKIDGDGKPTK